MKDILQNSYDNQPSPEVLIGKVITAATFGGEAQVTIQTLDGAYMFDHDDNCCESCDLLDASKLPLLLGKVLGVTGEQNNNLPIPPFDCESTILDYMDSYTQTIITFDIEGVGPVTLRWLGKSNGYYSELVGFWEKTA